MKVPVAKRKNLILILPKNEIKLSEEELQSEVLAEVKFAGPLVEHYVVGEKVIFNKNRATEITLFPETYWSIYEDHVTCGVDDSI
jgi:hypothetical protein